MAVLLFYSVIKFLLITLTQRSSKGHAVSGEASHPAREREGETLKEGANQYMANILKNKTKPKHIYIYVYMVFKVAKTKHKCYKAS